MIKMEPSCNREEKRNEAMKTEQSGKSEKPYKRSVMCCTLEMCFPSLTGKHTYVIKMNTVVDFYFSF